jgi:hypothetical protein
LDKLELELLLDDFIGDIGAIDQLDKQLLELLGHFKILHDVVVPFSKYLIFNHLHFVLTLTILL